MTDEPSGRGFPVSFRSGPVAKLVAPETPSARAAYFCVPDAPSVVLGSTQDSSTLDHDVLARQGCVTVRRRSGGGAVYVAPGAQIWLDLFIPSDDPLSANDVSKAALVAGGLWRDALEPLVGPGRLALYDGALVSSRWSRSWCFSGLGPGEVTLDGRKLVGVSQRRSREGAWLFTMVRTELDSARDASFLLLSEDERAELEGQLPGFERGAPGRLRGRRGAASPAACLTLSERF